MLMVLRSTQAIIAYICLFHLSVFGHANITLTWQDNSDNEEGFIIERREAAGPDFIAHAQVAADQTSFVDNTVVDGDSYCFRVQAFNAAGNSAYTEENCAYGLNINTTGTGSGRITASGIDCGSDCAETYPSDGAIVLTALPDSGSVFAGWTGDTDCLDGTVSMSSAKNCIATFALESPPPTPTVTLTVNIIATGSGNGSVSSSPAGIACGSVCSADYERSTVVTLTAVAEPGASFAGWNGGGCGSSAICSLSLEQDTSVSATFEPQAYALTVSVSGNGKIIGPGIDCESDCSESYDAGTVVTLTSEPEDGFVFSGFSGDAQCSNGQITMDGAVSCTATFTSADPIPGLISYWNFDEETGLDTRDSAIGSHHGTVNGATWTTGKFGSGLSFDGSDDYVDVGTFNIPGNAMTVAAWINPSSYGDDARILSKANGDAEQDHWWMLSFRLNQLRTRLKTNGNTGTFVAGSDGVAPLQQWSHVATTYDGSQVKIYLNGSLVHSENKTGQIDQSNHPVWIGSNPVRQHPFSGVIDEVRIYDRGLSQSEITDLFNLDPAHLPVPQANVVVNVQGSGQGSVTSSPAGIDCGSSCSQSFTEGTVLVLAANPEPASVFTGWSGGGCSGTNTCMVTLTEDTTINATFEPQLFTLSLSIAGSGTVTGPGIDCSANCSSPYASGQTVTLSPIPAAGFIFDGWSGDNDCLDGAVSMNSPTACIATFVLEPPPPPIPVTLTVNIIATGSGNGSVSSSPPGIACGSVCSADYEPSTVVTLTAVADPGSSFAGWTGGGCGSSSVCNIPLEQNTAVSAIFEPQSYALTVSVSGQGRLSGPGIDCGTDCSETYNAGTVVTLTPETEDNFVFSGFSGDAQCSDGQITMDGEVSCTATFTSADQIPGLISYWNFDEGAGTDTSDSAVGTHHGTINGATWTTGRFGAGLSFDGSDDYVDVGTFNIPGNAMTIAAWINPSSYGDDARILSKADGDGEQDHWWMVSFRLDKIRTRLKTSGNTNTFVAGSNGVVPLNQWSHLVTTYDGNQVKIYLNGSLVHSANKTGQIDQSDHPVWIGNNPLRQHPFSGVIDEVRIYDRGLSQSEVTDLFNLDPAHLPIPQANVVVNVQGSGQGSVMSSPAGIDCGSSCSQNFAEGTPLVLTANPEPASVFTGWSGGGCSDTDTCMFTLTGDTTVTAVFEPQLFTLSVSVVGSGTVSATGIDCGSNCSVPYPSGQTLTLSPVPDAGSIFTGWSGDNDCLDGTVSMNSSRNCIATFVLEPPPPPPRVVLTVNVIRTLTGYGYGEGSVSSSPIGIDCGNSCSQSFADGTLVTLTAHPDPTSVFTGWSGSGCSGTSTCTVTLSDAATVNANFEPEVFNLNVSVVGNGSVTGPGIECGADCTETYRSGEIVGLTAVSEAGASLESWSEDGCNSTLSCELTITGDATVVATFTAAPLPEIPILIGEVEVDHNWTRVEFDTPFPDPIVIVGSAGFTDTEPGIVRIQNVDESGFDIRFQEWDYLDDSHAAEPAAYIVIRRGEYILDDGTRLEADTVDTDVTTSYESVVFNQTFNVSPVVLTTVSTVNEFDAVTTRIRNIDTEGFDLRLREQEANAREHVIETVSYLAWETSSGLIGDLAFDVGKTPDAVRHVWYPIQFAAPFTHGPALVAGMQTRDGGDTAVMRWQNKDALGAEVKIEEEQSRNSEVNHTTEVVGYIAIE